MDTLKNDGTANIIFNFDAATTESGARTVKPARSLPTCQRPARFAAKFYPKADALRRGCDRQVEALLGQMAGELRANHLPLDLVDQVRAAYEVRIVERQAEILAKIGQ